MYHYHRLDTKLFKVFPQEMGDVIFYGRFRLKHEMATDPVSSGTWYAHRDMSYHCPFVAVDDGPWEKYDYDWTYKNQALTKELDEEITKDIERRRAERNKQLTAERLQQDRAAAKKKGVSVEELRAERKAEREVVVAEHKLEERVEYTNRLMKAAPMIRILHDDLEDILKKIERGEQIRIGHVDAGLRKLEKAQTVVARWRKSYQRTTKR